MGTGLALVVERVGQVADRSAGRGRVECPLTGGDALDSVRDVVRVRVFGQEAFGAGAQRGQDGVVVAEGCQCDDGRRVRATLELSDRGQATDARHVQVHQDDVGVVSVDRIDHLVAVGRFADDVDALTGQDARQQSADK